MYWVLVVEFSAKKKLHIYCYIANGQLYLLKNSTPIPANKIGLKNNRRAEMNLTDYWLTKTLKRNLATGNHARTQPFNIVNKFVWVTHVNDEDYCYTRARHSTARTVNYKTCNWLLDEVMFYPTRISIMEHFSWLQSLKSMRGVDLHNTAISLDEKCLRHQLNCTWHSLAAFGVKWHRMA